MSREVLSFQVEEESSAMIVRTFQEIQGGECDVFWGNGQSRRFLLEQDGMGFTLTDTLVNAGTESLIQYRHHVEACYCIEGEGEVELMTGEVFPIKVGTMYAPNSHDTHYLRAKTNMRLVCVFLPALTGTEAHNFQESEGSSY
jgi:L-ectoine synthase